MMDTVKLLLSTERRSQITERNRETITHLKFIGTFQPGEKINTRSLSIEPNNILTPILRRFFGEGRDSTYQWLVNTIERTFEIIQFQVVSTRTSDKLQAQHTVNDLIKAIHGLKNLQKTYKDDKLFTCNLESLIENIHSRLYELQLAYPGVIKQIELYQVDHDNNESINELSLSSLKTTSPTTSSITSSTTSPTTSSIDTSISTDIESNKTT